MRFETRDGHGASIPRPDYLTDGHIAHRAIGIHSRCGCHDDKHVDKPRRPACDQACFGLVIFSPAADSQPNAGLALRTRFCVRAARAGSARPTTWAMALQAWCCGRTPGGESAPRPLDDVAIAASTSVIHKRCGWSGHKGVDKHRAAASQAGAFCVVKFSPSGWATGESGLDLRNGGCITCCRLRGRRGRRSGCDLTAAPRRLRPRSSTAGVDGLVTKMWISGGGPSLARHARGGEKIAMRRPDATRLCLTRAADCAAPAAGDMRCVDLRSLLERSVLKVTRCNLHVRRPATLPPRG